MSPLLVLYILVGPALAWALAILTYFGRRRMDRLERPVQVPRLPDPPPRVTAFVPVRDEVDGVEACVRSLLDQDYPPDRLSLVVADDRSGDGTRDVLARLAEHEPRLTVLHVDDLPNGWLGKPHALHVAVGSTEAGDWLLFVDSDVRLAPTATREAVATASDRGYDAVSLLTKLVAPTPLEVCVAPVAAAAWLATFRASDTNHDGKPASAVANGQFLLVRRDALDVVGGHAAVRDQTCEDVALFRRMKAQGRRVRLFVGRRLAATRMHATWRQMFNGWARNFAGTVRHRPWRLAPTMAVAALQLLPIPLLLVGGGWALVAAAHLAALAAWVAFTARSAGLSIGQTLLVVVAHPLSFAALLVLLGNAVRACLGGQVTWRGNRVRA